MREAKAMCPKSSWSSEEGGTSSGAVRQFITETWLRYRALRVRRDLTTVVGYLTAAELPQQPMQAKLLLAFVALESLKSTYAKEIGLVWNKKRKKYTHSTRQGPWHFRRLLKEMAGEVGMSPALKCIVEFRNKIVHTGQAGTTFNARWGIYERTQDLVREYMLRLLGYSGEYVTYGSMDYTSTESK